jgi:hypothetical protein
MSTSYKNNSLRKYKIKFKFETFSMKMKYNAILYNIIIYSAI